MWCRSASPHARVNLHMRRSRRLVSLKGVSDTVDVSRRVLCSRKQLCWLWLSFCAESAGAVTVWTFRPDATLLGFLNVSLKVEEFGSVVLSLSFISQFNTWTGICLLTHQVV